MSDLVKKDLGTVSAYKYAKLHGYTGTEDEFGMLMASYTSVAQQAAESAESASASANSASASASNAEKDADRAEMAVNNGAYLWFYIEAGNLYMDKTSTAPVDFYMQDGKLYIEEV